MAIPILPITPLAASGAEALSSPNLAAASGPRSLDFSRLLSEGVQGVSNEVLNADRLVRDFAIDDSIPVHQVTYALEQARLSLDLMMQVRNRLVEAYQQVMNMQL